MPSGRWYDAEAGENDLPSPDETDVAGEPRVLLAGTTVASSSLSLAMRAAVCRYGLHDSERTDGAWDSVTLLCVDRRVGVGDEKQIDVEHSDRALRVPYLLDCVCFQTKKNS